MPLRLVTLLTVVLTVVLVFVVFVPSVLDANFTTGTLTECNGGSCVTVLQYDSVSYAYGGWGGYYQTGVNHYVVDGWLCSCPANGGINCCVPPYGGIISSMVTLILGFDLLSAFLVIHRPSPQSPLEERWGEALLGLDLRWGLTLFRGIIALAGKSVEGA